MSSPRPGRHRPRSDADTGPAADEAVTERHRAGRDHPSAPATGSVPGVRRSGTGSPPREVVAETGAGHGHGHGHGHGSGRPPAATERRVRIVLAALLVPCAIAVLAGVVLLAPSPSEYRQVVEGSRSAAATNGAAAAAATRSVDGAITRAGAEADCGDPTLPAEPGTGCLALTVRLDEGAAPGTEITTPVPVGPGTPRFAVGDEVVLAFSGDDPTDASSYTLADFQRGPPLALLGAVFAVAVVALGRWQGLAALASLGATLGVLALFVLPALLTGAPPVPVALVAAGLVVGVVFPLTHGASARTATAALGTLVSLALVGGLSVVFAALARLTGLGEQSQELVGVLGPGIDARGLLLAGVIIGALGVLDDMTVTQTSTVWELYRADPSRRPGDLYGSAMRVGRDHVASAVNTLVLAYAGAALPLLLLYALAGRGLSDLLTAEDVAQEVLRTVVGSIGVVASVPITTVVAAVVVRSIRTRELPA